MSTMPFPAPLDNGGSSNQFFDRMPYMPSPPVKMQPYTAPGTVPKQGSNPGGAATFNFPGPATGPGMTGIGKGMFAENPLNPALTNQFFNYLFSQIGQGVDPFNLSALLPTGGTTGPGQLSAPLSPEMQQLAQLFMPGGSMNQLATGGVSALPAWHQMVDAMQRQIGQGAANLKEQFNVEGGLASSPFGQAATDYQLQSNKDLNSLLGNMTFQGIQDQLAASGMMGDVGNMFQNLDQSSIDRLYQEFVRTSPQYNPLLGMQFGAATTFPPMVQPGSSSGILGSLLSKLPGAAGAGIKAGTAAGGGSLAGLIAALGALCWVAEVIYGVDDERTHLVRKWLKNDFIKDPEGSKVVITYALHGRQIAELAKKDSKLRTALKPWFDKGVAEARRVYA